MESVMIPAWAHNWTVAEAYEHLNVGALGRLFETAPANTTLAQVWERLDPDTRVLITTRRDEWWGGQ